MRNYFRNLAHNPRFRFWRFGTSGFTTTGKSGSDRWKIERTNANDVLEVVRGFNPDHSSYDRWLRGQPHMKINVSALDVATTLRIMQPQEAYSYFGQSLVTMSVVVSGPPGAVFRFGVGGRYNEVTTLGDTLAPVTYSQTGTTISVSRSNHGYTNGQRVTLDFTSGTATSGDYVVANAASGSFDVTSPNSATTSGAGNIVVPIMVTGTGRLTYADPAQEYMRIIPFEAPSTPGVYRIHYVDVSVGAETDPGSSEFELRPDWLEEQLISRYVMPVRTGMVGYGVSGGTTMRLPIQAPIGGFRIAPVIATQGRASTYEVNSGAAGSVFTASPASYSMASLPAANPDGCTLALGGFTSLNNGSPYIIGSSPSQICLLEADYF